VNRKEYAVLLDLIDQRIKASLPIREGYFRRYRRGINFHVHGSLEETSQERDRLYNRGFPNPVGGPLYGPFLMLESFLQVRGDHVK